MKKIIIIGGGVAGLTAAIKAKKDNNEVIVLEKNNNCLKKLLLTGNGHCNYYNDNFSYMHYYSDNDSLLKNIINEDSKKILESFYDEIGLVPRIKNGYYYPSSNQAYAFFNAILKEAEIKGVKIINNINVLDVIKKDKYIIETDKDKYEADILLIATGSKACPKTGSIGDGYQLALSLGHSVNKVYPALVQLTSDSKWLKELDGVRTDAKVTLLKDNKAFKEEIGELQFTNYGLSGICIFNLSLLASKYCSDNKIEVSINLLNNLNVNTKEDAYKLLEERNNKLKERSINELLEQLLNYKIVNTIFKLLKIDNNIKINDISKKDLNNLLEKLIEFRFIITGSKDYNNAQVCGGGIPLTELDSNFKSIINDNLYFIGELVDVTGECGGYNISFAVLSGIKAGLSIGDNND